MSYFDEAKWCFSTYQIPAHMREPMTDYIENGLEPGGFLTAVLENNLSAAVSHADEFNMAQLPAYANFLYNHAPSDCWGSRKKVTDWIKAKEKEREEGMTYADLLKDPRNSPIPDTIEGDEFMKVKSYAFARPGSEIPALDPVFVHAKYEKETEDGELRLTQVSVVK